MNTTPPTTLISHFQMARYQVLSVVVEQNDKFDPKAKDSVGNVGCSMTVAQHKTDPRRWTLDLNVELKPKKGEEAHFFPYYVSIRGRGFYIFKAKIEQPQAEHTLKLNGAAMLYGLLRAQVVQITAQSSHGQFLLPVLNFFQAEKAAGQNGTTIATKVSSQRK